MSFSLVNTNMITGRLPLDNFVQASTGSLLFGRGSGSGVGNFQEIFIGSGLSMSGVTLTATASGDIFPYVNEVYVDAGAMLTGVSGATPSIVSISNSGIVYDCLNFDAANTGYAQFKIKLADYNLGTVKTKFNWTCSGTGGVVFGIQGFAANDGNSMDSAWGTPQEITDSFITGTGIHITSATPSITIGGTPQIDSSLFFRVYRNVYDASDTLATNASLLGLSIQYTGVKITAW